MNEIPRCRTHRPGHDAGAGRAYLQVLDLDDLDHIVLLGDEVLPHLT
ncbi:MAG: hypothetical protein U5K30_14810 [Acidimicrobiales bacterium]|nr:hypothetical protein [Acidimicrobiales bacterium]